LREYAILGEYALREYAFVQPLQGRQKRSASK
jgi:hypothetical protein